MRDPLVGILERRKVKLAPDEPDRRAVAQATGHGDPLGSGRRARRLTQRLPLDLQHLHGIGDTRDLELAEGREGMGAAPTRHHADQVRGEDLPTVGSGAQAGGLDDRLAEVVVPLPGDLAAGDADAQAELPRRAPVLRLDRLLHGHRAGHGSRGGGEADHQTVTEVLDLGPTRPLEHLAEACEMRPAKLVRGLRRQRVGKLRRAHQVGKENRQTSRRRHPIPPDTGAPTTPASRPQNLPDKRTDVQRVVPIPGRRWPDSRPPGPWSHTPGPMNSGYFSY